MSTFTPLTNPERDELLRQIACGQPLSEGRRPDLLPSVQVTKFVTFCELSQTSQEG